MSASKHSQSSATGDDIGDPALHQLLSTDRGELLDIIDELRNSLSKYKNELDISLPRIVVCGDQSSGKSSVIEAICQRPFPKGPGVCTLFPTELKLRRGASSGVEASIKPAESRTADQTKTLSSWRPKPNVEQSFESIIQEAMEFLKKVTERPDDSLSYFEDHLQIELTHPSLPPLTLVDLPGIIHAHREHKQGPEDVQRVQQLVQKYLDDKDSIILPVISADIDQESHAILTMIKEADEHGQRTLGIITKPDKSLQTARRELYLRCARNEERKLELGWHVVKNQETGDKPLKLEDRDKEESEFFSTGVWKDQLNSNQLGIDALRTRLSELLDERSRPALGKISKTLKTALQNCRDEQDKIGDPRSTPTQQRTFLVNLSQRFQQLAKEAVEGPYKDKSFFEKVEERGDGDTDNNRLGAAKKNLNDDFAAEMRTRGHEREFLDDTGSRSEDGQKEQSLSTSKTSNSKKDPQVIRREEYITNEIERQMRRDRLEVQPGLANQWIISDVFREQSKRWGSIATQHIEDVRAVAEKTLVSIASHITTKETAIALSRHLIHPELDRREEKAKAMLSQVLQPYRRTQLITLDDEFLKEIGNGSIRGVPQRYISDNVSEDEDQSSDEVSSNSSFILDYVLGYYKVAMRTFIDNVANLVIEQCLFDDLTDIFMPNNISKMDDDLLDKLASESDEQQKTRKNLTLRERTLKKALEVCGLSSYQVPGTLTNMRMTTTPNVGSSGPHKLPSQISANRIISHHRNPTLGQGERLKLRKQLPVTPSQTSRQSVPPSQHKKKENESVTSQPNTDPSTTSSAQVMQSKPTPVTPSQTSRQSVPPYQPKKDESVTSQPNTGPSTTSSARVMQSKPTNSTSSTQSVLPYIPNSSKEDPRPSSFRASTPPLVSSFGGPTGFGSSSTASTSRGTLIETPSQRKPPFEGVIPKADDPSSTIPFENFQSITAHPDHSQLSFEELRLAFYKASTDDVIPK